MTATADPVPSTPSTEWPARTFRLVAPEQPELPGFPVFFASLPRPAPSEGYLCFACGRRIPVGVHVHACFYEE